MTEETKSCCADDKQPMQSCCCSGGEKTSEECGRPCSCPMQPWLLIAVGCALWYGVYSNLLGFAKWLTYSVLGITQGSHLGDSVEFFFYDTPKVLMLLVLVVFVVGVLHTFITPEATRRLLAGKRLFAGNILAALLGIVTPFCSCSAVPLFIGFVKTGVPLGVTFSFLISAPMVNEIALLLLFGLFGWKVAGLYLSMGLFVAIVSGLIIGQLKLEKWVEPWVYEMQVGQTGEASETLTWDDRFRRAVQSTREILGRVWLYVIVGIAVGAGIHGFVPQELMARLMGEGAGWWSVPVSVALGIPMYSNAAGIIPVVQALLGKGAALGTTLAFMMAVIALSLPELIILRQVLRPKLIAVFVGIVGLGILSVGWLFNWIF